jgi:1-acyl-sn-glycerol-3-phosphate acyltransferase
MQDISAAHDDKPTIDLTTSPTLLRRLGRFFFSIHAFIVFKFYVRLNINGKHLLPKQSFIICSNHQSHLDSIILAHVANINFNQTALIAAKDYWFDNKLRYRFASHFLNLIPINRKENDTFNIASTRKTVKSFINGSQRCVVILPEGTRSTNGEIKPFKKGISILALSLKLPIVPVYIQGTGKLWPKGSFFFKPGIVKVSIGEPVMPGELNSEDNTEIVRNKIIALKSNGKEN